MSEMWIAYHLHCLSNLIYWPITVASAERSFSKLKLLKNYLRSTMTQERLNDLATLCVEKLLDEININKIIDDFISQDARRNLF